MKEILNFLKELSCNNEREWFMEHKDEYKRIKERFDAFALDLLSQIRKFDSAIGDLQINDITYRIYRDVRFSADKSPYKTHMGVYICPGGKKSAYSGYYFQVSASASDSWEGTHMLAAGDYWCDPKVLAILREDIEMSDGGFRKILAQAAPGFELDMEGALKKVPAGFPTDTPDSDYYRLKRFCITYMPDDDFILAPNLAERVAALFKTTKPFLDFINRAVTWSKENND